MEEIKDIVNDIVRGCATGGLEVSEVLAAYVARTVVEGNSSVFALDAKVTQSTIDEVILASIERLLEKNNPALETLKMQVDFDFAFLKDDNNAQKNLRLRNKLINSNKLSIVDVVFEDGDYEALTLLYRRIFRFLLDFAPNARSNDRAVEKEVAAALESIFPRIGLKAFIQLSSEDKTSQLMELARIVLGIRLFNKFQGRGGAGIDSMDLDAVNLANAMAQDMGREAEFFADACNKYQVATQRAHLVVRREEMKHAKMDEIRDGGRPIEYVTENELGLEPIAFNLPPLSRAVSDRWAQELTNRRQYLQFLRAVQTDVNDCRDKILQSHDSIQLELKNLKLLISNKASIAKEIVYPRFDALGSYWVSLYEDVNTLAARSSTIKVLSKYRLSFQPTLAEEYYSFGSGDKVDDEIFTSNAIAESKTQSAFDYPEGKATAKNEHFDNEPFDDSRPTTSQMRTSDLDIALATSDITLLTVHNTPDFMTLPLELQGFCPWTVVNARGLLVPGKPALGVARYDNMYFVCDHERGLTSFVRDPEYYLTKVREFSLKNPEFIHLLKLQRWFPNVSIARLLDQDPVMRLNATGGMVMSRDASTSTPTHFNEGYIDLNYHWNEWELRRRAIKVVNLKNCLTTASQTDNSHFRREVDSQVYEQREKGSQTKRDRGVNPPIVTTYIAGLRGKRAEDKVSRYGQDSKDDKDAVGSTGARVVTLSLDL